MVDMSARLSLTVAPEVQAALDAGRPVVALESTIISHACPGRATWRSPWSWRPCCGRPGWCRQALACRPAGPPSGSTRHSLRRSRRRRTWPRLASRELPLAVAASRHAATTVASSATLARLAGIRVLATGGIGGVHRRAVETFDESADLPTLARTAITVVCAGVKSILDVPATLERLETLGVTSSDTGRCGSGFYVADSGNDLDWASPTRMRSLR